MTKLTETKKFNTKQEAEQFLMLDRINNKNHWKGLSRKNADGTFTARIYSK